MKRVFAILSATIVPVLLAVTVVSFAQQQREPAPESNIVMQRHAVPQGPDGVPPPPGDFFFVASEVGFSGRLVKNAPYSAQAVTETVQTLSDGNRIIHKFSSSLYRDSEGRTRRETTLKMLGNLGDSGEPMQTIFISDPVAGVSYALDSRTHIAHKSVPFKVEFKHPAGEVTPAGGGGAENQRFEFRVDSGAPASGYVVTKKVLAPAAPGQAPSPPAPENGPFVVRTDSSSGAAYVFTRKKSGPDPNEVTEQLGKQIIEGVEAEGTRTTITIPAGEVGNERPIEIVSERWYSPELQVVVMTRHSDPRSGETIYKLTNINRSEPVRSLFEVPGDYTIKEGMPAPPAGGVMAPARVRRPANPE